MLLAAAQPRPLLLILSLRQHVVVQYRSKALVRCRVVGHAHSWKAVQTTVVAMCPAGVMGEGPCRDHVTAEARHSARPAPVSACTAAQPSNCAQPFVEQSQLASAGLRLQAMWRHQA
jgi:hypothetical protein